MASQTFEKLIQEIDNMTVVQLSDFIKAIEEHYGVSAAMPAAAGAGAASASAEPAAAAKSEFKVTLKDAGSEKIKVIKALKAATTLSLSEAKTAVEGAPSVIAEAAPKEEAEKLKKALEEAGAKVELS